MRDFYNSDADTYAQKIDAKILSGELYTRETHIKHPVIPGIGNTYSTLVAFFDFIEKEGDYEIEYCMIENTYNYLSYKAVEVAYYGEDSLPVKILSILEQNISMDRYEKLALKAFYYENGLFQSYYSEAGGEPVSEENPDSSAAEYYEKALQLRAFFEDFSVPVPSILWEFLQ
ncbi:hypothetical protein JW890_04370 [candidate division WOR-3 bacterium]|nr:hypothetical protein [candidate division WOR-3 bacterium]